LDAVRAVMARCYSDDLRCKLLSAYDRGEGTLTQLAARFSVSVGWARKISSQRRRTGQAERVPHRPGRKLRAGEEAQQQVRAWFRSQPDLTLAEVQARLLNEAGVPLSIPQVGYLILRLGLRLKKSRSTPPSATPKPTSGGAKSISRRPVRSRRRG
jgi:transposase